MRFGIQNIYYASIFYYLHTVYIIYPSIVHCIHLLKKKKKDKSSLYVLTKYRKTYKLILLVDLSKNYLVL